MLSGTSVHHFAGTSVALGSFPALGESSPGISPHVSNFTPLTNSVQRGDRLTVAEGAAQ